MLPLGGFTRKSLDCCGEMEEKVLVNVCLHDIGEAGGGGGGGYRIFLKNMSFFSFFKLMDTARLTNKSA